MLGLGTKPVAILGFGPIILTAVIIAGVVGVHCAMRRHTVESVIARTPPLALAVAWGVMTFLIIIAQGRGSAFIYFQF